MLVQTAILLLGIQAISANISPIWISDDNYKQCDNNNVCVKKYFTLTSKKITGNDASAECASDNQFSKIWCPENAVEAKNVYVNLIAKHFLTSSSNKNFPQSDLALFGRSYKLFTGLKNTETGNAEIVNGDFTNYECTGNTDWDGTGLVYSFVDSTTSKINNKCVSIGDGHTVSSIGVFGNPYDFKNVACDEEVSTC